MKQTRHKPYGSICGKIVVLWCAASFFLYPSAAYAYLDPGTGNALVYVLVSLLGTCVFLLKSFGYRLLSLITRKDMSMEDAHAHDDLVLFSEGKTYWLTFKPIIEVLLNRNFSFTYLTLDVEDPALTIRHPLMKARYLGTGSAAFARVNRYPSTVMLATTPNIGIAGYPMPRPTGVDCLAHVFHGIGDVTYYNKYAFDAYDALLLGGAFMEPSVRKLEKLRNLPAKQCILAGFPYFDVFAQTVVTEKNKSTPCILVAPSWGEKSFLPYCDLRFVAELSKRGFQIIFRPHPHSFQVEKALLEQVCSQLEKVPNVVIDCSLNGAESMSKADVMISDKSGIRFDFAFLYERPVVSLEFGEEHLDSYEASDLDVFWEDQAAERIGVSVKAADFEGIVKAVEDLVTWPSASLAAFRDSTIAHVGNSSEIIADWAIARCLEKRKKEQS